VEEVSGVVLVTAAPNAETGLLAVGVGCVTVMRNALCGAVCESDFSIVGVERCDDCTPRMAVLFLDESNRPRRWLGVAVEPPATLRRLEFDGAKDSAVDADAVCPLVRLRIGFGEGAMRIFFASSSGVLKRSSVWRMREAVEVAAGEVRVLERGVRERLCC
jgi:hypothetical protein